MSSTLVSTAPGSPAESFVVVERRRGWSALDLREARSYRKLLLFVSWRDVLVLPRLTPHQSVLSSACVFVGEFQTASAVREVERRACACTTDSRANAGVWSLRRRPPKYLRPAEVLGSAGPN